MQHRKLERRLIGLDPDVFKRLELFCARTTRSEGAVIRAVLRMFLGDGDAGFQRADRMLSRGVWEEPDAQAQGTIDPATLPPPDEFAEYVVSGKRPGQPASTKRKSAG